MKLTSNHQRQLRSSIRGFLLTATQEEMEKELELSIDREDKFREKVIRELLEEVKTE